jgi:hypothetical protein
MDITYPPELLPIASSDDEAEVLVRDGAAMFRVPNPNRGNQTGTRYIAFEGDQNQKRH